MMAVAIHCVLPVRDLAPESPGDEFVLRPGGPLAIAIGMAIMCVKYFLQKQDIGGKAV